MKRITAFLLALVVAICIMIGCGSSDPITVGSYNGDVTGYYQKQDAKYMGHKGLDIQNPTHELVKYHCSLCHYVY